MIRLGNRFLHYSFRFLWRMLQTHPRQNHTQIIILTFFKHSSFTLLCFSNTNSLEATSPKIVVFSIGSKISERSLLDEVSLMLK